MNALQLILAGPGLIGLSRDHGTSDGEQQEDACDLGCHGSILACFCVVEPINRLSRFDDPVAQAICVEILRNASQGCLDFFCLNELKAS